MRGIYFISKWQVLVFIVKRFQHETRIVILTWSDKTQLFLDLSQRDVLQVFKNNQKASQKLIDFTHGLNCPLNPVSQIIFQGCVHVRNPFWGYTHLLKY